MILTFIVGAIVGNSKLPGYIKANYILLKHTEFLDSLLASNNLESIKLDVKFKHINKIEVKRQEALRIDHLISSDEDFVPALISYNNNTFNCKIRLKGDLSDHWENKKCSYRVKLSNEKNLFGMSNFSLQRPVTRGNTSQFLFLESLRRENIISVRYKFINMTINGKDFGVYAMEEHFSKDLIESQKRRDGIILSFDEYRYWKNIGPTQNNFNLPPTYKSASIDVRENKRINKSPLLLKQRVTALNLLRKFQENKLQGDEVFSAEKLGKFLAICRLWNAEHAFAFINMNFYYNPITSLLEPIGYDGMPGNSTSTPYCYFTGEHENWVKHALRSPKIGHSYIKHLYAFTDESYIQKLKNELSPTESFLRKILFKNLLFESSADIWKSDGTMLSYSPWITLEARIKSIRKELEENIPIICYARPSKKDSLDLEIIVRSTLTQPVEIITFLSDEHSWTPRKIFTRPNSDKIERLNDKIIIPGQEYGVSHFKGDFTFIIDNFFDSDFNSTQFSNTENLFVEARLLGMDKKIIKLPVSIDPIRFQPNKLPFVKNSNYKFPEFIIEEGDSIIVKPGVHLISNDLIIPANRKLKISPGTTLRFQNDTVLICKGPLIAMGTQEQPIIFTANQTNWPGMLVVNASKQSQLHFVEISKTAGVGSNTNPHGLDRGGWTLTGGITFYNSSVSLSHCNIHSSFAEDALNLVSSRFSLSESTFSQNSSDGVDGDFVEGIIQNCTFNSIGGDALDFSGSKVKIINVIASEIVDKAISAGENSSLTIEGGVFNNIGYGIASKDLSNVEVRNTTINKAKVAAVAAFQKKELFGPSSISLTATKITNTSTKFLIQEKSTGRMDGNEIKRVNFDIKTLY